MYQTASSVIKRCDSKAYNLNLPVSSGRSHRNYTPPNSSHNRKYFKDLRPFSKLLQSRQGSIMMEDPYSICGQYGHWHKYRSNCGSVSPGTSSASASKNSRRQPGGKTSTIKFNKALATKNSEHTEESAIVEGPGPFLMTVLPTLPLNWLNCFL